MESGSLKDKYGSMPLLRLPGSGRTGRFAGRRSEHTKSTRASSGRLATIRQIGSCMRPYRWGIAAVMLLVLLSAGLSMLAPLLLGRAFDNFLYDDGARVPGIVIGLAAVYSLLLLTTIAQNYLMIGYAQRTVADIRRRVFDRLQAVPISFYAKYRPGDLMSRLTNDIEHINVMLSTSLLQVSSGIVTLSGMLIVMLWLSPLLTLVTLTTLPTMYFGLKWITARTEPLFRRQQQYMGDYNGMVEEALSGQLVVKSFGREDAVIRAFDHKNRRLRSAAYWAQTYTGFLSKLFYFVDNLGFALIIGLGSLMALRDWVTVGLIVTFAEFARQFVWPLSQMATQFNLMLAAIAGAERVFGIENEAMEEDDKHAEALPDVQGEVVFDGVSFSYRPGEATLRELSFRIRPGQTVALVGPTGAGKSTVAQLLARFYEVDAGAIYLDGTDIRKLRRRDLRSAMGFVLQDALLFQTTVRENIRYGRLNASDEDIVEAARLANAHSFIMSLPEQYDTVLQQSGTGISHGQKQLLTIARAILADPAILVLDEATSSVDAVTELAIQKGLKRLLSGRTSIMIAHRLSTIAQSDRILVLDNGQIREQGTHRELLADTSGLYFRLFHQTDEADELQQAHELN